MAKHSRRRPVIPEPSPQIILWSAVAAAFVLVAIVILDYANGWAQ